ncbi:hypothetical protein [Streptomyces sp. TRM68367]|uniref:hypothetical protein n=1 Tax=Streptomyces sp. TRM68367 TaxID=2758415 RepID=UPI00165C70C8|nr:hypothetical protein [Streptomyces sp. TRM68367]MBC9729896.1 hypothetical protein [Streptomyces sp. TRM68367]
MTITEPFGPEYLAPAQPPCPDCECCTARLCEKGRNSLSQCHGHTTTELMETVAGCPCSSPRTRGTHAWRIARINATRTAVERPLDEAAETVLRALHAGEDGFHDPAGMVTPLRARGYVQVEEGVTSITELGRTYLTARDEPRFVTPVEVEAVDLTTRTARVVVVGWHMTEPVTVLADQLANDTGLHLKELEGAHLEAAANCRAKDPDDIVLTAIRVAPPLPEGWLDGTVTSGE